MTPPVPLGSSSNEYGLSLNEYGVLGDSNNDPRPFLEARCPSRDAWAERLAEAVDRLVAERLLLAEDGDRLTATARESWDVYQEI